MKKIYLLALAVFFVLIFIFLKDIKRGLKYVLMHYNYGQIASNGTCPNCANLFTDVVSEHSKAYQTEGILPQQNDKGLLRLLKKGVLVKIKKSEALNIEYMPYSKPYVLPKCRDFVQKLSQEYAESCTKQNLKIIPIQFSSGTRTIESVSELTKENANAIDESPHLKGKTFDINYKKFGIKNKRQVEVFVQILHKYNKADLCYVKFERNGCLHITVN
jgi:hypothetical protein